MMKSNNREKLLLLKIKKEGEVFLPKKPDKVVLYGAYDRFKTERRLFEFLIKNKLVTRKETQSGSYFKITSDLQSFFSQTKKTCIYAWMQSVKSNKNFITRGG